MKNTIIPFTINKGTFGFKLKDDNLEIGLFDINNKTISSFNVSEVLQSGELIKVATLNNNSFSACLSCKAFFIEFDNKEYSFEQAISFLKEQNYKEIKG